MCHPLAWLQTHYPSVQCDGTSGGGREEGNLLARMTVLGAQGEWEAALAVTKYKGRLRKRFKT